MTLLSNHFYPGFFCANYCVVVASKFSPCCSWLGFPAHPRLLFFYSGYPDVCTAIIIIIKKINNIIIIMTIITINV